MSCRDGSGSDGSGSDGSVAVASLDTGGIDERFTFMLVPLLDE
jgi:hypothetical protein